MTSPREMDETTKGRKEVMKWIAEAFSENWDTIIKILTDSEFSVVLVDADGKVVEGHPPDIFQSIEVKKALSNAIKSKELQVVEDIDRIILIKPLSSGALALICKRQMWYEELWRNSEDMMVVTDTNGGILDANKKFLEFLGLDEVKGLKITDFIEKEYVSVILTKLRRITVAVGLTDIVEVPLISTEGRKMWVEVLLQPITLKGKVRAIHWIARDITTRKEAERKLRESEEMFRMLAERAPVGMFLTQRGSIKYLNLRCAEMLGYKPEELINRQLLDFIHPEDRELIDRSLKLVEEGWIESFRYSVKVVRKGGEDRTFEIYGSFYKEGSAVLGMMIDLTEKLEMEKRLQESEEKFRKIVENSPILIALVDENGVFVEANPSMIQSIGSNTVGRNFYEVFPPDVAERRMFYLRKCLEEDKPVRFEDRRGGRHFLSTFIPVEVRGRKLCLVIASDISSIKLLNELLLILNEINDMIMRGEDIDAIFDFTVKRLGEMYVSCIIGLVTDDEIKIFANEEVVDPKCVEAVLSEKKTLHLPPGRHINGCRNVHSKYYTLAIPMKYGESVLGVLVVSSYWDFSGDEREVLSTLANNLAFVVHAKEAEEQKWIAYEQIERNIEQFAVLADKIRNPLAAISLLAEIESSGETKEKILRQVDKIKDIVDRLDSGWLESEQLRMLLRKYWER